MENLAAFIAGYLITTIIAAVIIYVLLVIAMWKLFKKAGQPGWKSIIPFYNLYIAYKITWSTKMFAVLIALAVVAGILLNIGNTVCSVIGAILYIAAGIIEIIEEYKTSVAYGHGFGFFVGLFFLPTIFYLILGFGGSKYVGPNGKSAIETAGDNQ